MKFRSVLLLLTLLLAGCPDEAPSLAGHSTHGTPLPSGMKGGLETASPPPAASATPTRVAVKAVHVDRLSVTLYPPPLDSSLDLGLPTQTDLSAYAELSGNGRGEASWSDRSGGKLAVSATGSISVKASTIPGTYFVRAQAIDDPNVYQDVIVVVASHGDLDLDIR